MTNTSLNKLNSIVIDFPTFSDLTLKRKNRMLLYRKENSELDSYCRHNVCSSHLYISRQNIPLSPPTIANGKKAKDISQHVQEF